MVIFMITFVLAFFALGAVVGSFVGVVSERVHTGQSFVSGRSRCNSCARMLDVRDLVPIASWLISQGACRVCRARIPVAYVVLEGALGLLFVFAYLHVGVTPALLPLLFVLSVLAFTVVYDMRHTIVPPYASLLLILGGGVYAFLASPSLQSFGATLFTAGLIAGGFLLLHVFSGGRAMGLGDAPVALALAFVAGQSALSGLLFSFWIGAVFGIIVLALRRGGPRMGIEVPFVPFLALGFLLAYFTGWNPLFSTFAL